MVSLFRSSSSLSEESSSAVPIQIDIGGTTPLPPPESFVEESIPNARLSNATVEDSNTPIPPPPPRESEAQPPSAARLRESQRWSLFNWEASASGQKHQHSGDDDEGVPRRRCCKGRPPVENDDEGKPVLPACMLNCIRAESALGGVGLFCNYLETFPSHLVRAFNSGTLKDHLASKDETKHLCRKYQLEKPTQAYYPTTLNLLPWRRSSMFVLVVASFVTALATSYAASESRRLYLEYQMESAMIKEGASVMRSARSCTMGADGLRYCDMSLGNYIALLGRSTQAAVIQQSQFVVSVMSIFNGLMSWFSLFLAVLALRAWDDYSKSKERLMYGWLATILLPFGLSFVPLRLLIDFEPLGTAADALGTELAASLTGRNGDDMASITAPCASLIGNITTSIGGRTEDVGGMAGELCAVIPLILEALADAVGSTTVQAYSSNTVQTYSSNTNEGFAVTARVFETNATTVESRLSVVTSRLRLVVEGAVGVWHGGVTLRTMLPTAVSLAPALLRGAMRCKMMLPQSSIPGMFIILLPWLYCPLAWCCYNFIYQLVGDGFSFGGLFLLAWAPLAYSLLGIFYQAMKPMGASKAARMIKTSTRITNVIQLSAVGLGLAFALESALRSDFQTQLLESIFAPSPALTVATFIFTTLAKYLYTTIVGLDVMMTAIAEQFEHEEYFSKQEVLLRKMRNRGKRDDKATETIMNQRTQRLKELRQVVEPRVLEAMRQKVHELPAMFRDLDNNTPARRPRGPRMLPIGFVGNLRKRRAASQDAVAASEAASGDQQRHNAAPPSSATWGGDSHRDHGTPRSATQPPPMPSERSSDFVGEPPGPPPLPQQAQSSGMFRNLPPAPPPPPPNLGVRPPALPPRPPLPPPRPPPRPPKAQEEIEGPPPDEEQGPPPPPPMAAPSSFLPSESSESLQQGVAM